MSREAENADLSALKIPRDENFSSPDTGKKKWFRAPAILVIFAIILIGVVIWNPFSDTREVQITTVLSLSPAQMSTILNASGYIVAQRKAAVASKATGRLVFLGVEEGDFVKKGDVIARIESEDVEAQLAQGVANRELAVASCAKAEAELTEAELYYNRMKALCDENLVSRAEFDNAEARYRSAVAGLEAGRANVEAMKAAVRAFEVALENTRIRAPFDGTVLNKYADVGEIVAPFAAASNTRAAVVTLASLDSLQVEADVSESNIERIRIGMPCEIVLDAYPERAYRGIVHKIVPTADRSKATVLTKIRLLDQDDLVLPEMSTRVSFLSEAVLEGSGSRAMLAVYKSAVVTRDGRSSAFRVVQDKVEEIPLETGAAVGEYVEIIRGLEAGNILVLNPTDDLSSGARIRIAQ